MTDEIRALLAAIPGPHAAKKRTTVIKLAFARANQQPVRRVFGQADTCAENIWYMKWRFDSAISTAHQACYDRALQWADDETAVLEEHHRRRRRRSVARYAAQAPLQLARVMKDGEQRGADRISAADALMRWAEPELARAVGATAPAGEGGQVNVFAGWSNDELEAFIGNIQTGPIGAGQGAAGETEAAGDGSSGPGNVDEPAPAAAGTGQDV